MGFWICILCILRIYFAVANASCVGNLLEVDLGDKRDATGYRGKKQKDGKKTKKESDCSRIAINEGLIRVRMA